MSGRYTLKVFAEPSERNPIILSVGREGEEGEQELCITPATARSLIERLQMAVDLIEGRAAQESNPSLN